MYVCLTQDTGEDDIEETPKKSPYAIERKQYEKLCRGEMDIPSEIAKRFVLPLAILTVLQQGSGSKNVYL